MKTIIVLVLLLVTTICSADELRIPYSCYPRELQQRFLDKGYIVDLSSVDRTRESWGFIVNEGSQYKIYTYKSVTKEELQDIMELINGK